MAVDSYTRITANRLFDSLNLKVDFQTVDKVIRQSRGFCHQLIKEMTIFTSMKNQIDHMNYVLNLNQEIIVELIFKHQTAAATDDSNEPGVDNELNSLREYSEKMLTALHDLSEKITIHETKFMQSGREAIKQWQNKQVQSAEIITDALMAAGEAVSEPFTRALARHLFLEIANEKTFDAELQINFAVQQAQAEVKK